MIGRVEGQVILVAGAIPGERVVARVERTGKGVAYARTVDIEARSEDRRDPFTDPQCGGCLYAHIAYSRQLEIKARVVGDAFARIGRMPLAGPPSVARSPDEGYRMRARLHVRGGRAGFFREGTHEVCDARATRQLLPDTCGVLEQLAALVAALGKADAGDIEFSENLDASGRAIHLDMPGSRIDPGELFPRLDGVTGLSAWTSARSPSAAAPARIVTAGDPHVVDALEIEGCEVRLRRHVLAFFQGNRYLLRSLVLHVLQQLEPGGAVMDLYAGVGLFAVSAALVRGVRVTAVEGDRVAAQDLAENAKSAEGRVVPLRLPIEAVVAPRERPSAVIVDPPRTGMSREALDAAIAVGGRTMIYVSCDVATLARDARRLVDAGYELEKVDCFDLFPNTPHVESVAVFRRA